MHVKTEENRVNKAYGNKMEEIEKKKSPSIYIIQKMYILAAMMEKRNNTTRP
jgi:hypothetical protein